MKNTDSMDTFSLYDDIPLFSGDLLPDWSPLADDFPLLDQDVLQPYEPLKLNPSDDVKGSSINEVVTEKKTFDDNMFGVTKMNLLDMLENDHQTSLSPIQRPLTSSLDINEDLLSTVSEMLVANINSEQTTLPNDNFTIINIKIKDAPTSQNNFVDNSTAFNYDTPTSSNNFINYGTACNNETTTSSNNFINYGTACNNETPISSNNFIDYNTVFNDTVADNVIFTGEEVTSFLSNHEVENDVESFLGIESKDMVADILSPVSPEDVDYLLSSNPTSPCSNEELFDQSTIYSTDLLSPSASSIATSSAEPQSPEACTNNNIDTDASITVGMKYLREELLKPTLAAENTNQPEVQETKYVLRQKSRRQRVKAEPYSPCRRQYNRVMPEEPVEHRHCGDVRKRRKKQQNKDAAFRYRHKKREQKQTVTQECEQLESRNNELHEKVDSMTREIQYLKDLLAEVYQAKSTTNSKPCK